MRKVTWVLVLFLVVAMTLPAVAMKKGDKWPDGDPKGVNMFNDFKHMVADWEAKAVKSGSLKRDPRKPTVDKATFAQPAQNWTTK